MDTEHLGHCLAHCEKKAVRDLACFVLSPSTNLRAGDEVESFEAQRVDAIALRVPHARFIAESFRHSGHRHDDVVRFHHMRRGEADWHKGHALLAAMIGFAADDNRGSPLFHLAMEEVGRELRHDDCAGSWMVLKGHASMLPRSNAAVCALRREQGRMAA